MVVGGGNLSGDGIAGVVFMRFGFLSFFPPRNSQQMNGSRVPANSDKSKRALHTMQSPC